MTNSQSAVVAVALVLMGKPPAEALALVESVEPLLEGKTFGEILDIELLTRVSYLAPSQWDEA